MVEGLCELDGRIPLPRVHKLIETRRGEREGELFDAATIRELDPLSKHGEDARGPFDGPHGHGQVVVEHGGVPPLSPFRSESERGPHATQARGIPARTPCVPTKPLSPSAHANAKAQPTGTPPTP